METTLPPRRAAAVVVALLLSTSGAVRAAEPPRLVALEGEALSWSDLETGDWVIVAWASWSPRCRDIVDRVNALDRRWGDRARLVTLNFQEEPSTVRAFLQGKRLRAPVYLDRNAAFSKRYSISHLPGLLVLREGEIRFVGQFPREADAVIEKALAPRPAR